jgi:hypothetical protein
VTVQASTNDNGTAIADCGATSHVVSGGAFAASGNETADYPSDSAGNPVTLGSTNPRYWTRGSRTTTPRASRSRSACRTERRPARGQAPVDTASGSIRCGSSGRSASPLKPTRST